MLAEIAISVAQVLLSAPIVYDPITVQGHGQTFEQAKESAFRQAIETEVGVLVLSERETKDYQSVKNTILAYSGGYVKEFKVVSQNNENGQVNVTLIVTVAATKLKNQILSQSSDPTEVPKDAGVQIKTYKNSKSQGDKLLENVMKRYPQAAYSITETSTKIKVDSSRNAQLQINFTLQWSQDYLEELSETLKVIQDSRSDSYNGKVIIRGKTKWFVSPERRYFFADRFPLEIMNTHINQRDVRIRVNLKNDNNVTTGYVCNTPASFLQIDRQNAYINGHESERYIVNIPEFLLENVTHVELQVDDVTHCK